MSDQVETPGAGPAEEPGTTQGKKTVTEEIKVQAEDLFQAINNVLREGTAQRITILRKGRVLVDIPLVAGVAAGALLAFYLPVLSTIVAVGALFGGCTVRIEREEPPTQP